MTVTRDEWTFPELQDVYREVSDVPEDRELYKNPAFEPEEGRRLLDELERQNREERS